MIKQKKTRQRFSVSINTCAEKHPRDRLDFKKVSSSQKQSLFFIAELSHTRSVRRGAPWVRKFSYLPIRESLVMT